MGCMCSNIMVEERPDEPLNEESVVKQYSWDKRESIRQRDHVVSSIQGLNGETSVRQPGSSSGQQMIIQNCQNSFIYIFDNLTSVLVEDCKKCQMFLGPTETSVTFKDSEDCLILSACQQFQAKNCLRMSFFLCCATRPVIENSRGIKFFCFQFFYPQLEDHMHRAQLSVYNNFWSRVYDASSPSNSQADQQAIDDSGTYKNFEISPEEPEIESYFIVPECFEKVGVKLGPRDTIVPYMPSKKGPTSDKSCLVMFFNDGLSHDRARTFIRLMRESHPECNLVQGRELVLKEAESSEIFNSDKYAMAVKQGPVIGLEYCGNDCRHFCQETLVAVSKGSTGLVFISAAKEHCQKQVEAFRRFAQVKLGNIKTPESCKKRS